MSIGVGTLQPKTRIIRPVWMGGLLALVVVVATAVAITNDPIEQTIATESRYSGTAANTPTEIRYAGSAVSGTAANTPSELSGGVVGAFGDTDFAAVPHVPKRTYKASTVGGTQGNTPTEISGGNADFCHQCR